MPQPRAVEPTTACADALPAAWQHGCARQRGFTLIELIVTIGLIALLAKTAGYFWNSNFSLAQTLNADSAAIADGRATLERLAREIREVKYGTAGTYCVSSTIANPSTQMVFRKNAGSAAGACGTNDYTVTVSFARPTLTLAYSGSAPLAASAPLTNYASDFRINYYNVNFGAAAAGGSDLRFVDLSLTVQPSGGQQTVLHTVVALRN